MRPWKRIERRTQELDAQRIGALSAAARVDEARALFDELTANYSPEQYAAELQRRRQERIDLLRTLRK